MTETAKKSKRNNDPSINQTVANRGLISANWQKFLAYNLIADKKIEKPLQENSKEHFTGTFRRARKKKTKTQASVRNDLKTLDIAKETNVIANNDDNLANKELKGPKKQDNSSKNRLTKFIAIDCEMVGIGYDGSDHMLARVSLVNKFGDCIYDKFVKPREEIIDYRTSVSGVRREDLINGEEFSKVQKDVAEMIRGKILVGHSLKHDLSVLFLSHPKRNIRDTSRYKPFRKITKGSTPSLKRLAKDILGIEIQHGEHSSVEDARAAMQLYCTVAKDWERMNTEKRGHCLSISADDGEEDPKFPFGSMPKGTFNMDDFKRCYSNEDLSISIPYFWQKFDPDHYSIWYAEYKYPEELAKVFMSCNLISDMMQRLYKMQKQAFASVCLFGDDNNSSISGVWVWRGRELAFPLSPHWQTHYETYQWTRLDPADPATKQLVQKYFSWSGTDRKWRKFNQGKIFK